MKKKLFVFLCLMGVSIGFGWTQSPTMTVGKIVKTGDPDELKFHHGDYGTAVVMGFSKGFSRLYTVGLLDDKLNLHKVLKLPKKQGNGESMAVIQRGGVMYALYKNYDSKSERTSITYQTVNMKTLTLNEKVHVLVEGLYKRAYLQEIEEGKIRISSWGKVTNNSGVKEHVSRGVVLDKKLTVMSDESKMIDLVGESLQKNTDADLVSGAVLYIDKDHRLELKTIGVGGTTSINVTLFVSYGKDLEFVSNEESVKVSGFNTQKKKIRGFAMKWHDGKIIGNGLYAEDEKKKSTHIDGIYTVEIDPSGQKVLKEHYEPIAEDILKIIQGNNFRLSGFVKKSNGGSYLAIQRVGIEESVVMKAEIIPGRLTPDNKMTTETNVSSGSIVLFDIAPSGIVEHTEVIRTWQNGLTRTQGYLVMVQGDELYLVLRDNDQNFNLGADDKAKSAMGKHAVISLVSFSDNLESNRTVLKGSEAMKFLMNVILSESVVKDELYGVATNGKDSQFFKVSIK